MSNEIPRSFDPLVQSLADAADGAHDYGTTVGLKQNDEAALRAALTALIGVPAGPGNVPPAVPGLKDKWNTAKMEKTMGTAALRSAKSTGRAQARACIGVLKPTLGDRWNNSWQAAGFTNHSLAVPNNPLTLLQQIASYFASNPGMEQPTLTPFPATAAACVAAATAITNAAGASNTSNMNAGLAKRALEGGIEAGRSRMTGLRNELTELLDPDDDLWDAFGFDKPADQDTPEMAEHLTLVAGAAGSRMLFGDWDDAVRASSYRAQLVLVSDPTQVVAEAIVSESDVTFTLGPSVAPGTAVQLVVRSRSSSGGESGPAVSPSANVP